MYLGGGGGASFLILIVVGGSSSQNKTIINWTTVNRIGELAYAKEGLLVIGIRCL
jgi:hypothetical protein